MRKISVIFCALILSGCAWLGFGDDSDTVATAEPAESTVAAAEPEAQAPVQAEPAKTTQKGKAAKGTKSEAQIKVELDAMGQKLAGQSARTLLPNKSKPEYKQVGGEWIASYIDVDTSRVTTEMKPGANGQYVGFIRYQERFMECRGATKQAAMKGPCTQVKTRNLNEMIRYDGKQWLD